MLTKKRHNRYISNALMLLCVLVVLYALSLWANAPVPVTSLNAIVFSLAVIILGLVVPYWILKLTIHAGRRHPRDRELQLVDLPKDEYQMRFERRVMRTKKRHT